VVRSGGVDNFWPIAAIARWLDAAAVKTAAGLAWPADPKDPKSVNATLYAGTPGVVLFYLEAEAAARRYPGYHPSAADLFRAQAKAGADELLARIDDDQGPGLYEGLAGIGFALEEAYKALHEPRYRQGFLKCLGRIRAKAAAKGKGIEWGAVTDIISGTAGTGLFLLYAADELKDRSFVDTAAAAAERLIVLGRSRDGGLDWPMDPSYPRLMPNFSHGTAGIAYFLVRLYEAGGNKAFLDAAVAGARHLLAISNDACLIYPDEPDGKDLFYLGWCHGPVGTANLFVRLAKVTGDASWMTWVRKAARTLMMSGIPDRPMPGFWNNAGICCGLAGMADFFRDLGAWTGDPEYRAFAGHLAARLMETATREGGGLYWVQAEHRTRPDLLVAQTGLMQGAAGIGLVLLRRLLASDLGAKPLVRLPDVAFF
jgi:lantibiotic modifying enzyme